MSTMSEADRRKNPKPPFQAQKRASAERKPEDTASADEQDESKYLHTGTFRVAHKAIARIYTFKCAALLDFLFQMALAYGTNRGGYLWVQVLQTKMAEELNVSLSTVKRMIELLEDDRNGPRVVEVRQVRGQGKHPSNIYRIDRRALKTRLQALEKEDEQKDRKGLEGLIDQSAPRVRRARKPSAEGAEADALEAPSSPGADSAGAHAWSPPPMAEAAEAQDFTSTDHEAQRTKPSDMAGPNAGGEPSVTAQNDLSSQVKMNRDGRSERAALTGQNASLRRESNRSTTNNTPTAPQVELPPGAGAQQAQDVVVPFLKNEIAPPLQERTDVARADGGSSTYAPIRDAEHLSAAVPDGARAANGSGKLSRAIQSVAPASDVRPGSEEDVRILASRLVSLGMDGGPAFMLSRQRPDVVRRQLEFWRYRPEASNPNTDVPAFLHSAIKKDWGCRQWAMAQRTQAQTEEDRRIAEERRQQIAQEEEERRAKTESDIERRAEVLRQLAELPAPVQEALNKFARWEAGERWKFQGLAQGILVGIVERFYDACRRHAPADNTDCELPGSAAALVELSQIYSSASILPPMTVRVTAAPRRTEPYDPVENWASFLRSRILKGELRVEDVTSDFLHQTASGLASDQIEPVRKRLEKMLLQEEVDPQIVG